LAAGAVVAAQPQDAWLKQKTALSFAELNTTSGQVDLDWSKAASAKMGKRLFGGDQILFRGPVLEGMAPVSEPTFYFLHRNFRIVRTRERGVSGASTADALPFVLVVDGNDWAGYSGYLLGFDVPGTWECAIGDNSVRVTCAEKAAKSFAIPFEGAYVAGFQKLAERIDAYPALAKIVRESYDRYTGNMRVRPDLALFFTALAEWCEDDGAFNATHWGWDHYLQSRINRRDRLLSDTRLQETLQKGILFSTRRSPVWQHCVAQYFGWEQNAGGDVHVLTAPGRSLKTRNLTAGKFPSGAFLEPSLSFDADKFLFSFVETKGHIPWNETKLNEEDTNHHFFHLWEMDVNGNGLRQLTNDRYEDLMPCYLPDGDIAFMSTRRKSMSRCFGRSYSIRWQAYTLFRMKPDGSNLTQLSWNDVSEWFPIPSNDGEILFARWDYIDRDAVRHQNLWSMRPDGTNPHAVFGNETMNPQCAFQIRPVPGSRKIACIASAHHCVTGGPLILIDPSIDENSEVAVTHVTPGHYAEIDMPIPGDHSPAAANDWYNSPWPYAEDLFLVSWSRHDLMYQAAWPNPDFALGVYVLAADGRREVLYRDGRLSANAAQPLVARKRPPFWQSQIDAKLAAEGKGEVFISDVYCGLKNAAKGSLKEVRVVQVFPRTQPDQYDPYIGGGGHENARAVLGSAKVEEDGSARFHVPAQKPILFQVLDEKGYAWRTMRSSTSLMPGEHVSCVGCHEPKREAAASAKNLSIALKKPPQKLASTPVSGRPWGFVENVQPIFDAKCISCHGDEKSAAGIPLTRTMDPRCDANFTHAYACLFFNDKPKPGRQVTYGKIDNYTKRHHVFADGHKADMIPCYGKYNTVQTTPEGPGRNALGSGLVDHLTRHPKHKDLLTDAEMRMIATWLDLNATFIGCYEEPFITKQRKGEPIPMPTIQ